MKFKIPNWGSWLIYECSISSPPWRHLQCDVYQVYRRVQHVIYTPRHGIHKKWSLLIEIEQETPFLQKVQTISSSFQLPQIFFLEVSNRKCVVGARADDVIECYVDQPLSQLSFLLSSSMMTGSYQTSTISSFKVIHPLYCIENYSIKGVVTCGSMGSLDCNRYQAGQARRMETRCDLSWRHSEYFWHFVFKLWTRLIFEVQIWASISGPKRPFDLYTPLTNTRWYMVDVYVSKQSRRF